MDDPARSIAAIKIGTRIVLGFKLLDSSILYILPAPNCAKSTARGSLYPVPPILKLAGHDACVSEIFPVPSQYQNLRFEGRESAPLEEQEKRKRRLLKGPTEFREIRDLASDRRTRR